jgi:hypothetical protein
MELRKHSEEIINLVSMMRQVSLQTGTVLPGLSGGQVLSLFLFSVFFF